MSMPSHAVGNYKKPEFRVQEKAIFVVRPDSPGVCRALVLKHAVPPE
jgi:hypothetical protein